jgi:hypothetical protein
MTLARLTVNEAVARHVERAADTRVVDCETRSSPRLCFCTGMPDETWQALGQSTERAAQDMRQCFCLCDHSEEHLEVQCSAPCLPGGIWLAAV